MNPLLSLSFGKLAYGMVMLLLYFLLYYWSVNWCLKVHFRLLKIPNFWIVQFSCYFVATYRVFEPNWHVGVSQFTQHCEETKVWFLGHYISQYVWLLRSNIFVILLLSLSQRLSKFLAPIISSTVFLLRYIESQCT